MEAMATFEVMDWDEHRCREHDDGTKVDLVKVKQSFQGGFEGEGTSDFVIMYDADESRACFTGSQHIVGHVGGREGNFLLSFMGTFKRETGLMEAEWFVIPETATDELRGLRGEGGFTASHRVAGSAWLEYDFDALTSGKWLRGPTFTAEK